MKRKILIEIDIPESNDLCWKHESGFQVFHDTILVNALAGATLSLGRHSEALSDEDNRILQAYRERNANIVMSCKTIGYIDDNDILNTISDNRCEFDKQFKLEVINEQIPSPK